ncbi:MAG: flavodoxin family protein [Armatimonadota bacterium]
MKITAVNGSPRGKNSNTHIMVEEFLKGAKSAGAETSHIHLAGKNIKHCMGCFSCWIKTPGACVIKDDMQNIMPLLKDMDIFVIATPLYFFHVTGLMKNFIDRLLPMGDPHFEKDKDGVCKHLKTGEKAPKLVIISNCGFPEQIHFEPMKQWARIVAKNMDSELIAEIYRGEGELLKADNLMLNLMVTGKYKKLLQMCGKEVIKDGYLSDKTKEELEKPLVPYDMYIKEGNKQWDKMLEKIKNK